MESYRNTNLGINAGKDPTFYMLPKSIQIQVEKLPHHPIIQSSTKGRFYTCPFFYALACLPFVIDHMIFRRRFVNGIPVVLEHFRTVLRR